MRRYRKTRAMLLTICAALLFAGCSTVATKHPLSKQPKPIDREKFEGVWLMDDETVHVRFASNGVARIAALEWKDDQFEIARGEMVVTEGKEHNLLCVRFQEDAKWMDRYYFLQYEFTDQGDLVLWLPDGDAFEQAIKRKRLRGTISKQHGTDITITSPPENLLEFINDPGDVKLFKHREPIVLQKVVKRKKAQQRRQTGGG